MSTDTQQKEDVKIEEPKQYAVVILNDDYTSIEFVTMLIQRVFHLSLEKAELLAHKVHKEGKAIPGIYPFEIAESKANLCITLSTEEGFPLETIIEPA